MSKPCPHGEPHRHPASITEAVHWELRAFLVALLMAREAHRRGWIK